MSLPASRPLAPSTAARLSRRALVGLMGAGLGVALAPITLRSAQARATPGPLANWLGASVEPLVRARAQAVMAERDGWLTDMGAIQRQAIVNPAAPSTPASNADLLTHLQATAQDWSPASHARWQTAASALGALLVQRFQGKPSFVMPPMVQLIQTDGRDSAGAPYTRGDTIFLPTNPHVNYLDVALLAHELFHIVSRRNPTLADRAYAVLGFTPVAPLAWPADWEAARIVNPDAPDNRHASRQHVDGRDHWLMPVLVATRPTRPGEPFFAVAESRLLSVRPAQAGTPGALTQAVQDAHGQPLWFAMHQVPDYVRQQGDNTSYLIHPEETIADNFALWVTGGTARNPQLIDQVAKLMRA